MSNMTRTASNKADAAGLTEEQIRILMTLPADHRVGAADVASAIALQAGHVDNLPENPFKGLDFPVSLKPIYFTGPDDKQIEIPGRAAVVRDDRNETLNVVSDRYGLRPHVDVFGPVLEAIQALKLPIADMQTHVGMAGGYARVEWILGTRETVLEGDDIQWVIRARNSYNYESVLGLEFGAYRLICSNGLRTPVGSTTRIRKKHYQGLNVEEIVGNLQEALEHAPETLARYQDWTQITVEEERMERWLKRRSDTFSKKGSERILELFRAGESRTLWEAYNAFTFFATHEAPSGSQGDRLPITQDRLQDQALAFAVGQEQRN